MPRQEIITDLALIQTLASSFWGGEQLRGVPHRLQCVRTAQKNLSPAMNYFDQNEMRSHEKFLCMMIKKCVCGQFFRS